MEPIYEKYDNEQFAQGEFDADGDGIPSLTAWKAEGEDVVNTIGGGIQFAVIPQRLDLKVTYSYSEVDGEIDFSIPGGTVPSFNTVDDTKLHTLDANLKYNIWGGYFVTVGYLWEKFDYDDFNKEGFSSVPTDAAGNLNGAILSDTLWSDYNAYIFYTKLSLKF